MKLWTIIDLVRIPNIFQHGITNPYHEEIQFHVDREDLAEMAIDAQFNEEEGYIPAFIEVEFPDEELNDWFTVCLESNWIDFESDKDGVQQAWERGDMDEEQYAFNLERLKEYERALEIDDVPTYLRHAGYACLYRPVPPEMIRLLDPSTMMDAVLTGDQQAIVEAADTAEIKSLETLGPNFWVWLIMFMAGLFGPEWGAQAEETEAEKKAKKRRKRRVAKKKKKPKRKKAPKRRRRRKKELAGVWA